MPAVIKLSDAIIAEAKPYAIAMHRSVPKQIEYWARLGKAVEENPDLSLSMVMNLLLSLEEAKAGKFHEYELK